MLVLYKRRTPAQLKKSDTPQKKLFSSVYLPKTPYKLNSTPPFSGVLFVSYVI